MPTVEHLASMSPEEFIKFLKDSDTKEWPGDVLRYAALRLFRMQGFVFKTEQ